MKRHGFVQSKGIDRSALRKREAPQALARDDLKKSFAGNENKGPKKNQKTASQHGSKTKERRTGRNVNNAEA